MDPLDQGKLVFIKLKLLFQMLVVRAESMTTTTVSRSTRSRTASSFSSGGFDTGTYYGLGTGDGPITTRATRSINGSAFASAGGSRFDQSSG